MMTQCLILLYHDKQIRKTTNETVDISLARETFVQIEVSFETSNEYPIIFKGSGALIGSSAKNNYVLTANHLCNPKLPEFLQVYELNKILYVIDVSGEIYHGKVVSNSDMNDLCLIEFEGDVTTAPLKVSPEPAVYDDKVFAYAAPTGFFAPYVVPLFEGRYAGDVVEYGQVSSAYTIPATGGSSGAAILNGDGEIVGVIHSSLVDFQHIILASRHEDVVDFLDEYQILSGVNFLTP